MDGSAPSGLPRDGSALRGPLRDGSTNRALSRAFPGTAAIPGTLSGMEAIQEALLGTLALPGALSGKVAPSSVPSGALDPPRDFTGKAALLGPLPGTVAPPLFWGAASPRRTYWSLEAMVPHEEAWREPPPLEGPLKAPQPLAGPLGAPRQLGTCLEAPPSLERPPGIMTAAGSSGDVSRPVRVLGVLAKFYGVPPPEPEVRLSEEPLSMLPSLEKAPRITVIFRPPPGGSSASDRSPVCTADPERPERPRMARSPQEYVAIPGSLTRTGGAFRCSGWRHHQGPYHGSGFEALPKAVSPKGPLWGFLQKSCQGRSAPPMGTPRASGAGAS
ncbi:tetra-peptide repeat homeobox protein 1-like [Homarus americanus]|uniref:tetra-peptide repeat homeobox protein 1-like n=1 Tax=Homarus americanus TaxID=6706 RepID=UPI001C478D79|nr:tetra-peptide repeat homeobox protein 1-like [Homarus americanus]